jgi:hypothetical protein
MLAISRSAAMAIFKAKLTRGGTHAHLSSRLAAKYGITPRAVRAIWNLPLSSVLLLFGDDNDGATEEQIKIEDFDVLRQRQIEHDEAASREVSQGQRMWTGEICRCGKGSLQGCGHWREQCYKQRYRLSKLCLVQS